MVENNIETLVRTCICMKTNEEDSKIKIFQPNKQAALLYKGS